MQKQTKHIIEKTDIEITPFEMRRILGDTYDHLDLFLGNIYCPDCKNPERKKLVNYKPYLNRLNDVVLRGECAGCQELKVRYLEVGENPDKYDIAQEVRELRKKG